MCTLLRRNKNHQPEMIATSPMRRLLYIYIAPDYRPGWRPGQLLAKHRSIPWRRQQRSLSSRGSPRRRRHPAQRLAFQGRANHGQRHWRQAERQRLAQPRSGIAPGARRTWDAHSPGPAATHIGGASIEAPHAARANPRPRALEADAASRDRSGSLFSTSNAHWPSGR